MISSSSPRAPTTEVCTCVLERVRRHYSPPPHARTNARIDARTQAHTTTTIITTNHALHTRHPSNSPVDGVRRIPVSGATSGRVLDSNIGALSWPAVSAIQ